LNNHAQIWLRCALAVLLVTAASPDLAQDADPLAKEVKNPLANVTNVQFLYDADLNVGSQRDTEQVFTIQPVIPFSLDADWSLITRTVLPVIYQPALEPGQTSIFGAGDTQLSAFLSPARTGALVWGIGPVLQIPTASNDTLGQGKWAAGPCAAAQWSGQLWTFGALITNVWSVAGSGNRAAVNQMQLQPEINYNFQSNPNAYLTFSPTLSANWQVSGSERWTVPVSLGIGQLFKLGKQSINLQATAYYNLIAPPGTGNWTLEVVLQFLFPK
jgi:hypothetical protein